MDDDAKLGDSAPDEAVRGDGPGGFAATLDAVEPAPKSGKRGPYKKREVA